MPVRKFRDFRDMEDTLWRTPGDPELYRAIADLWAFSDSICPLSFPPGVYKHRSIEDAQKLREEWDEANFQAFHLARGRKS